MNRSTKFRSATGAAICLILASEAVAAAPKDAGVLVVSGDRVVAQSTRLRRLVIAPGGALKAADNRGLTLTVDGVGQPIVPGTYAGDVMLTVTDDIPVQYKALPPHHYRAALYVEDGKVVSAKSVEPALGGGSVSDSSASDVVISSLEPRFNGIVVTGSSKYTIESPTIRLVGNGGNDFAGFGAAIMSSGHADVTVNNARILNRGAVRTAIFVGGNSVMHVNNSMIETYNGTLPPDYKFTIEVGRMMEVPWMLGLKGNVRATNLVADGTVYYANSYIRTQGWGALSTDDAHHVRMYVSNCLIETVDSGYGAYSIGDSIDTFSRSVLNVADIGTIIAGPGSAVFTDGTVVNSNRFGVMMHSGRGGGMLTIDKGSQFNTKSTAIQIKGRGGNVLVDGATVRAGNGIILEAMPNDDPFMKKMMAGPIVGMQPGGPGPGGPGGPGGPPDDHSLEQGSPDVAASFRNVDLKGDMLNARTSEGDMMLSFKGASITGALSTATAVPTQGKEPTAETYYLIGDVTNTLVPTQDKHGLQIDLDGSSRWTVTKTSYLTKLSLAHGAVIDAAGGGKATITVDGKPVSAASGDYAGRIVVSAGS